MGSCTCLTPDTWEIAATITAGSSASISTTPRTFTAGLPQPLAAAFGDTAALLAMALTCLELQAIHSTRAATGWAAKLSSDCKQGQLGRVSPAITGRLAIGSRSITVTKT